jgi:hypothetical protein
MRPPQIGFPALVQDFFLKRLVAQRGASARTVESYRDAFELLFAFTAQHTAGIGHRPGRHRPLARALFWGADPVLMCSVSRGETHWLSVLLPIVRCAPM